MVVSESRGMVRRLTEGLQHFAMMHAVGTRRKHSGCYRKDEAGSPRPAADFSGQVFEKLVFMLERVK